MKPVCAELMNKENDWEDEVSCEWRREPASCVSTEDVVKVVYQMTSGKSSGTCEVAVEIMQTVGDIGIQ